MKTPSFVSSRLACALLALGLGALLHGQPMSGNRPIWEQEASTSRAGVQRFSPAAENNGMMRMTGRPVLDSEGQSLSTISDFLVDPQTGRVHFAILPSGGGPHGMTYRIVPISAFQAARDGSLTLRLSHAQWDHVGTMEEGQLQAAVTIDVDHQERLSRQLGLPLAEIYDGHGPAELVRASSLKGQPVRSGNGNLGRIEDVVIDVNRHEAAIVLSTDRSFGGAGQRFVVPFQHVGRTEGGAWSSRLTREDFALPEERAMVRGDDRDHRDESARVSSEDRNREPRMDERGRERAMDADSVAAAVRQTLEQSWPRARIEAVAEGSRVVLRGVVDTEQDRQDIERMVSRSASGVRIDNQLAVRQR